MRVANNPRATAIQIYRLANRDLNAALLHPNASLDFLMEYPEHLDVILQSPAWALHCLDEPERTMRWVWRTRTEVEQKKITRLCQAHSKTGVERRRLVAWAVECAGTAAKVWRAYAPEDKQPANARRMALRWVLGILPGDGDLYHAELSHAALSAANVAMSVTLRGATTGDPRIIAAGDAADAAASAASAIYSAPQSETYSTIASLCVSYVFLASNAAADAVALTDQEKRLEIIQRQLMRLRDHLAGRVLWLERALARIQTQERRAARL